MLSVNVTLQYFMMEILFKLHTDHCFSCNFAARVGTSSLPVFSNTACNHATVLP